MTPGARKALSQELLRIAAMADGTAKPVIFISYSHKDEPEHPRDGEVQWLSFVRTYLQPAVKHSVFDLGSKARIISFDCCGALWSKIGT